MRIEPEISGVSIVLLGDFNPAIFTPAWFALHKLLPESVANNAELQVAHQQATAFDADWLQLRVVTDQFSAETSQAPYIRLCDLVLRVFKEHLHHTPLKALGINRSVHFRVGSFAERDRIGRTLAPIEPWGTWAKQIGLDGEHGGMRSLTMTQINPEGRAKGDSINVTVEPSNRVGEGRVGIYVSVNDHYSIENPSPGTAQQLMGLLEENFETSIKRSDGVIDHIMSLEKK